MAGGCAGRRAAAPGQPSPAPSSADLAAVAVVLSWRIGAPARFAARGSPVGCRLEAEGLERFHGCGPIVLAANHASYADIAILVTLLPVDFLFVAKHKMLRFPLVGAFVRRCSHLTVNHWDALQSVTDADLVARALR
jgi:hypothetical protein